MKKIFSFVILVMIFVISFAQMSNDETRGMGTRSRTWIGLSTFDVTVESEAGQQYILCFGEGELTPGYTIDKVKFYFRESYGSTTYDPEFNIKIYTGGNRNWIERNIHTPYTDTENAYTTDPANKGTLQYSQSFTASGVGHQIVALNTPFEIPSTGEVWIALECEGIACVGATKTSDTATVWTTFLRDNSSNGNFRLEVPLFRKNNNGELIVLPYQYCMSVEVNDQIDRCDFSANFYNPTTNWTNYKTPFSQQIINFEETYDNYYRVQLDIRNAGPDSARKQLSGHFVFTDAAGQTLTIDTLLRTMASVPTGPNGGWVLGQNAPGMALIPMATLRSMTFPVNLDFIIDFAGVDTDNSNDTAHLTIIDEASFNIYDTAYVDACESYYWEGSYYYYSGEYNRTYSRAEYGDSILTLYLNIYNNETITLYESVVGGYVWDGQTYCSSGNYINRYQTAHGCDSTVYLYLTVTPITTELHITAQGGYIWDGLTYTSSGNYIQRYQTDMGCDSTVYLYLTVEPITTELHITACDSYEWDGLVYTGSGNYIQRYQTAEGWDSTVYLYLTIERSVQSAFAETACGSYTWNDTTYTTSGSYTQHFDAETACDSVVTLLLTIQPNPTADLYDTTYNRTAYNDNGFSIPASDLMEVGDYVYTQNIPQPEGCDSIITLYLTVINHVGVANYNNLNTIFLYPNPANDNVSITATESPIIDVCCYNIIGAEVATYKNVNDSALTFDVSSWKSGVYLIKVTTQAGIQTLKLTVNR